MQASLSAFVRRQGIVKAERLQPHWQDSTADEKVHAASIAALRMTPSTARAARTAGFLPAIAAIAQPMPNIMKAVTSAQRALVWAEQGRSHLRLPRAAVHLQYVSEAPNRKNADPIPRPLHEA